MRGIAVLVVVIFHYTSRLPPEALGVAAPPLIVTNIGKVGVNIFFILSGYLIAQSIEKSGSLGAFYAKRVARIWPLFAFASLFVFAAMQVGSPPVVPTGPYSFNNGDRTLIDILGSIFFLRDLGFEWADGAYWSILVEMKFYFLVGLFAAVFRNRFVDAFAVFAVVVCSLDLALALSAQSAGEVAGGYGEFGSVAKLLHGVFISNYLPLFALGMMLYKGRLDATFCAIVALSLVSTIIDISGARTFDLNGDLVFLLLLSAALFLDRILLGSRIFLWLGRYSYSIYLFHQMIGLTIIKAVAPSTGINAAVLLAIACVLVIAWGASWLVEWRFYRFAVDTLNAAFRLVGLDRIALASPTPSDAKVRTPGPVAPQPGE